MDIAVVNKIKRLAIIALASDDALSEALVLKGGNAIDLAYNDQPGAVSRTSFDLVFPGRWRLPGRPASHQGPD